MRRARFTMLLLLLVSLASSASGESVAAENKTRNESRGIFEQYVPATVQVRVVERVSNTKSSIGSGFLISPDGKVVTNYHVISEIVFEGGHYDLEVIDREGKTHTAEIVSFDLIHDLALLQTDIASKTLVAPTCGAISQGEHLFSLGNPHDLGTSVVEGIYNGLIADSTLEHIHFTGSINEGMSGGPTLTAKGELAGVNVSSSGDQVSFLVPCKFVASLVSRAVQAGKVDLLKLAAAQLLEHQEHTIGDLLKAKLPTATVGAYTVPSQLSPGLKCWSKSETRPAEKYSFLHHTCNDENEIFVNQELSVGAPSVFYMNLSSTEVNQFQFASLVEDILESYKDFGSGAEDDFTKFRCISNFLRGNGTDVRAQLCLRRYRRLEGLYDLVLVTNSLDAADSALIGYFAGHALSFENAQKLARALLNGISRSGA